jgi:AP endonuclease-1
LIAECINKAHSETETVKVVLENSAGGANSIGSTFEDLRGIIDLVEGTFSFSVY